jgi:hypothetical protein
MNRSVRVAVRLFGLTAGLLASGSLTAGLATAAPPSGEPTGSSAGVVVLVVADATALTNAEGEIEERLTADGYDVVARDDATVAPADLEAAAFGLVSSTVGSVVLGDRLAGVSVPLWIAKPYLFDEYGMTGPDAEADYGTKEKATVKITRPAHALAAGHDGKVTFLAKAKNISWGDPPKAATVVAKVAKKPTIFTIPAGGKLVGGDLAAGCRMTFPLYETAPLSLTETGWEMFDAAAAWAAAGCSEQLG